MEKELQGYEAEVSRLKLAVLTLETKRNRLKKRMEEYKSLLAPIHKAPPEILHNIFTFCCDGTEFKTTEKPPAMALSTVCGRWREVFISTPSLWSSFSIHFSAWRGQYKALGCLTRAFLAHSQGSLLTLKLNLGDVSKESISSSQPLLRVLNSLIQSSTRWRWLELTTDVSILRHPVFDALRGHLPKLKDFHLTGVSCAREVEDGSEMDCFGNCPTLLNVTLQRTDCGSDLVLPWQQITTMQLHTIFSYDAIMFLKSCRNLTHLRLTETGEDDESDGGASLVADQGPFVSDVEDLSITAFWLDQVFFPFSEG
ncbi:hypothetical protein MPER_10985 [Moniliophthora perniciosa FA553]|nr:hypothetical protein MPER_10985 [Moniliophthora perniciosa FA553]